MVEQIFEEAITTLMRELDQWRQKTLKDISPSSLETHYHQHLADKDFPPAPWIKVFEHFAEYEHLYRALLGDNGSSWFRKKMRTYLADMLLERARGGDSPQHPKPLARQQIVQEGFVPTLLAGQLIDAISWWLEHDRPYTPRQIAGYSHRLILANLLEVNTWS